MRKDGLYFTRIRFHRYQGGMRDEIDVTNPRGSQQQVSFFSDAFPRCEEDDKKLNPQRWGYKAAEYLREELEQRKVAARGPYAERWGWALRVMHGKDMFMVGCGIAGDETNLFLVIISPIRPFLSLFGKKPDPTPVASVINAILQDETLFQDVEWEPESR